LIYLDQELTKQVHHNTIMLWVE